MSAPVNQLPVVQAPLNKQRADKFRLVLTPPKIFTKYSINNVYPDTMQYSVYGTLVPSIEVPAQTVGYAAQSLKVSSYMRSTFADITVNYTIDNRFYNYYFIYKWLDILNDDAYSIVGKDDTSAPDSVVKSFKNRTYHDVSEEGYYMTDFVLYSLDEYNKEIAKFTYTKAFPVSLGEITANYRDASQLDSSFTFAFSQLNMELLS